MLEAGHYRLHELYADATALAWGFGPEYAEAITYEDGWQEPGGLFGHEGCLLPHIVGMYRIMKDREIRDGTLEDYVQQERSWIESRKAKGARRKAARLRKANGSVAHRRRVRQPTS